MDRSREARERKVSAAGLRETVEPFWTGVVKVIDVLYHHKGGLCAMHRSMWGGGVLPEGSMLWSHTNTHTNTTCITTYKSMS